MSDAGDAGDAEVLAAGRPGAYVLRLDGMDQSHVDLSDPTRLDFPYVRRLAELLDARAPTGARLRVVHVGGAGLTLARYVAATRPSSAQVVLEPAAAVTELVRERLPLPARSGIKVRATDGRTGLAALAPAYADAVVLDAFADARVPGDLVTVEAWDEVARVLRPDGWAMVNLVDRAPFAWTRRALAALREAFADVVVVAETATLAGRRPGNLVVAASSRPLPVAVLRDRTQRAAEGVRLLDDAAARDALGGGRPFTDADTEPSPRLSAG